PLGRDAPARDARPRPEFTVRDRQPLVHASAYDGGAAGAAAGGAALDAADTVLANWTVAALLPAAIRGGRCGAGAASGAQWTADRRVRLPLRRSRSSHHPRAVDCVGPGEGPTRTDRRDAHEPARLAHRRGPARDHRWSTRQGLRALPGRLDGRRDRCRP